MLPHVVRDAWERYKNFTIWTLEGDMGAGKTTFISALARHLKTEDTVSSPTFSLVNEYYSPLAGTLYHFDFFRIRNEAEALDMGCEEYFYSGRFCWIEWPSKIPSLIPEKRVEIVVNLEDDGLRTIIFRPHDAKI